MNYKYLFTDFHTNIHHEQMEELSEWYEQAKEMLDFWPIAYYPYYVRKDKSGIRLEDIHSVEEVKEDWKKINDFVLEKNKENKNFPIFNGYEWQGACLDGDHNVFFKDQGPLVTPMRYQDLYNNLKDIEAIAIPHHLAYSLYNRGKNWNTHIEKFSPFAEIYSSHGSSESGDTDIEMSRHIHMGPRTGGTSVFDGLKMGHKIGIIASGDNHLVSAQYGHGFAGVLAEDNTKDKIWDALLKRRVYGMTKGRVKLFYEINENVMGSEFETNDEYLEHHISVETQNSIDRFIIYRNGIPNYTYNHSENWMEKELDGEITFKFKIEFGWGPDLKLYPDIKEKIWKGKLKTEGKVKSIEKCWTSRGQNIDKVNDSCYEFELTTRKTTQSGKWMGPSPVTTEGFVFEIEANINSKITLEIDNKIYVKTVRELLENTDLIVFLDEAKALAKERFNFDEYYRSDPFYQNAYKVRLMKAKPEISYKIDKKIKTKFDKDAFYLVKVYETDGSVSWSSPIWVNKK
ncbi:DUF3604 domain-containing protein [Haloimpatiens sp. FM7315]|uniref:DUF3604 domain-containing protein n=1 Tax=Haloimpatiens sp. FM7315 TaxID=3298609 RepID=UPI0035A379B2